MEIRVPYSIPFMPKQTESDLIEAFRSTRISGNGRALELLEGSMARELNARHCFAVSNGSAAIRMALLTLGFRPGMRVILPGWGFHVAANIAYGMGANLEFRDVDLDSWCMNLEDVFETIEEHEDVFLILIHTLGNSSNLKLLEKAQQFPKLRIIEDAAEAMFSKFNDKFLGTHFNAGTFSFHAAKTITTGEGGLVVVNSDDLADTCRLIRSHGMNSARPYFHEIPGDNFRLSNLLAALALAQLNELSFILEERIRVFMRYRDNLSGLAQGSLIKPLDEEGFFPWGFGLRLGDERARLRNGLEKIGVETRPGFSSATQLPYYNGSQVDRSRLLRNSDLLSDEVLLLPHYPTLSNEIIDEISDVVSSSLLD
jgi:perosamine synthetase